jgi:hypothetical protein
MRILFFGKEISTFSSKGNPAALSSLSYVPSAAAVDFKVKGFRRSLGGRWQLKRNSKWVSRCRNAKKASAKTERTQMRRNSQRARVILVGSERIPVGRLGVPAILGAQKQLSPIRLPCGIMGPSVFRPCSGTLFRYSTESNIMIRRNPSFLYSLDDTTSFLTQESSAREN